VLLRKLPVNESRKSALLLAAILCCVVLNPVPAHAQWWGARAPADYEECAESAEKAATKEAKATQLAECGVKFAARRKPGGGYSYFDFMQNRHFDIAGPNPTPEEQKFIDEQYAEYLSRERKSAITAAFTQKQQQLQRAVPESEEIRGATAGHQAAWRHGGLCRIPPGKHELRQGFFFVQLAAACRGHQGLQEAVRRVVRQGQTQPAVNRACDV
jgi:hypothetical protein